MDSSRYTTVQEKPNHNHYLRNFRVEPCPLFKNHQCQQHRPFSCYDYHFQNQRRRRPVQRPDGTFNYSADVYCTRYDENSGICPDGDNCSLLHRVAGDVERKYHLRYYKTALCVHASDSRGVCTKNGPHCAFAHSPLDMRQPQYDAQEMQNGSLLDPENRDRTSFVIDDPLWQDHNHVLSCYKTEPCKKPARLCRQGYACPFYHNSKDRRRPPALNRYRSTPCPAAKSADEWLEPEQCEKGDDCMYCHTRTEQQFHPEIYKSTKCNDITDHGYCPRAVFCAFAHHESEMHVQRTPYYKPSDNLVAASTSATLTTTTTTTTMLTSTTSAVTSATVQKAGTTNDGNMQNLLIRSDSINAGVTPNSALGTNPTYSAVLKHRQNTMKMNSGGGNTEEIAIYSKAPGFERVQISPQRGVETAIGRIRTSSLNMGQIDLGYSVTGQAESLGSSLPSNAINTIPHRSTNEMRTMPSAIEEHPLSELGTFSSHSRNYEQQLFVDLLPSSAPISSTSSMQNQGSNGASPMTPFSEALCYQQTDFVEMLKCPTNSFTGALGIDHSKTDLAGRQVDLGNYENFERSLRYGLDDINPTHQIYACQTNLRTLSQIIDECKRENLNFKKRVEKLEAEKKEIIRERDEALSQLDTFKQEMMAKSGAPLPSFDYSYQLANNFIYSTVLDNSKTHFDN